jgi:hypothetical protein
MKILMGLKVVDFLTLLKRNFKCKMHESNP